MKVLAHIVATLCLLFGCCAASAQSNWLRSAGGLANDEALSVKTDVNGAIVSTGYFSLLATFGQTNINSAGYDDVFIYKQSSNGTPQWVVSAGGNGPDRAYSVALDSIGDIYITGYFSGTADFGPFAVSTVGGPQDIDVFVAKYNSAGTCQWVTTMGGTDAQLGYGVAVDRKGEVIVTGQFKGTCSFGAFNFTSATNPVTGNPSHDVFIAKLDTAGTVIWAKQGSAIYDDRGTDVATDSDDNIYITGQFSDTISFTNTYNNNMYNAGFLLKLDSLGNEVWFRRMGATSTLVYAVEVNDYDEAYIGGEFQGQLAIFTNPVVYSGSIYQNMIFIAKFNKSGDLLWVDNDGSDNAVTATELALDSNQDPYLVGTFNCRMDEYSAQYGSGIFYSIGYRDVFIVKYSASGQRQWMRHFGGPKDDVASGITVTMPDRPVIAGSYYQNFNVTTSSNFNYNSTNYCHVYQSVGSYCGDNAYGSFCTVNTNGNKDIFITNPVDLTRKPYDYFLRSSSSNCVLDSLAPCINQCQDTLMACDHINLFSNEFTVDDNYISPTYTWLWNTGDTTPQVLPFVTTSGTYTLHIEREDGCWNDDDTVIVVINQTPPAPLITDSYGINVNQAPMTQDVLVCYPDTINLIGSGIQAGNSYQWSGPTGIVPDSITDATVSGSYTLSQTTPFGCTYANNVDIWIDDFATYDTLAPHLIFTDPVYDRDTVELCMNGEFDMILIDSAFISQNGWTIPYKWVLWSTSAGLWHSHDSTNADHNAWLAYDYHVVTFGASTSGWYTVNALLVNICNADTTYYPISDSIYVLLHPNPPNTGNISGPAFFCPQDTVLLVGSTGGTGIWNGPGIVSQISPDSILVNLPGTYIYYSVAINQWGCSTPASALHNLQWNPAPIITMIPSDGLICPFDSVQFIAPPGLAFEWVGPNGNVIGSTQTIYADVPGYYYCIVTGTDSCVLVSNFLELKEYNTPYLIASPGNVICANGTIQLNVETSTSALIVWDPPLSGNSPVQVVSQPGTYSCSVTSCGITTPLSIVVTPSNTLAQITATGPTTICHGDTLILSANSGMVTYQWSPGGGNQPMFSVSQAGTYYLQTMDQFGCYGGDTITIDTLPTVPAPTGSDTSICAGTNAIISATATGLINWYAQAVGGSSLGSGATYITPILNTTTIYYAENSDTGCTSVRTPITVYVSMASLSPNVTGDTLICGGDSILLTAINVPGATYLWSGPSGFSDSLNSILITPVDSSMAGYYYVSMSDSMCSSPVDSVEIMVFDLPSISLSTTAATICMGDSVTVYADTLAGTYLWSNGDTVSFTTVNAAGNYSVIFTDSNGCASIADTASINVSSGPTAPLIYNDVVCQGETAVLTANGSGAIVWMDTNMNVLANTDSLVIPNVLSDTLFWVQAIDSIGCTSSVQTATVTLSTASLLPVSLASSSGCTGSTIYLSSVMNSSWQYNWSGPGGYSSNAWSDSIQNANSANSGYYYLFVSDSLCTSPTDSVYVNINPEPIIMLNNTGTVNLCSGDSIVLTANVLSGAYLWSDGDTGLSTTVSTAGLYYVIFQDTTGCVVTSDTISVNYWSQPNAPQAADTLICSSNSVLLTASGNGTIFWFDSSMTTVGIGPSFQTPVLTDTTTYFVSLVDLNGCQSPVDTVTVYMSAAMSPPVITGDSVICQGEDIVLSTTNYPNTVYYWNGPNGNSGNTSTLVVPNATLFDDGVYTLYIIQAGCTSQMAFVRIDVTPLPPVPLINAPDTVCDGDTIHLSAMSITGAAYNWNGPVFTSTQQFDTILNASQSNAGTYIVNATLNGCSNSDTALVWVHTVPVGVTNASTPICVGDNIYLSTTPVVGAMYAWGGPAIYSFNGTNDTIFNAAVANSGYYTVKIWQQGCVAPVDSVLVEVIPYPVIDLGPDTSFCEGTQIQMQAQTGYPGYLWSNGSTANHTTILDSGWVVVTVTDGPGCASVDSVYVAEVYCPSLSGNVFSPNRDGVNDEFRPTARDAIAIHCRIYDRWGKLVYEWTDPQGYWDGRDNEGNDVPEGVYYYVFNVTNLYNKSDILKGYVHVVR